MKQFIYFLGMLLFPIFCFTQNWQKSYDLIPLDEFPNSDRGINIKKTSDGFVILSGSLIEHNELSCFGLIKIDNDGEVLGKNVYADNQHFLRSFGYSTIMVDDDNVIVAGDRYTEGLAFEYFLAKMVNLDTVWFKTYTGDFMYYPRTLLKTRDGNYLIHGDGSGKYNGKTCTDITLVKTDTSGNELWRKTLGYHTVTRNNQYGNLIELENGNLALTFAVQEYGFIKQYTHVAMLDSLGNTLWNKRFYTQQNGNPTITETIDGNLLFATNVDTIIPPSQSPFVTFLTTIDRNGNILKEFYFNPEYVKRNTSILVDKNGDFVICGLVDAFYWPTASAWFAKVSREGNLLWERYYALKNKPYSTFSFLDVEELENGFILSGDILDTTSVGHYNVNVWVVKLDENGCYDPSSCTEENLLGITEIEELPDEIQIYPNPSSGLLNIRIKSAPRNMHLKVYNSIGAEVTNIKNVRDEQEVNLEVPGTYYFVFADGKRLYSKKVAVVR